MRTGRSMANITIQGDAVAARCCAHLLRSAGLRVSVHPVDRPRVPAIMIGDSAVALIRDVFGMPSLFCDLPRISRRLVAWGDGVHPNTLAHSAIVVSEQSLLASLSEFSGYIFPVEAEPHFTIYITVPRPP